MNEDFRKRFNIITENDLELGSLIKGTGVSQLHFLVTEKEELRIGIGYKLCCLEDPALSLTLFFREEYNDTFPNFSVISF